MVRRRTASPQASSPVRSAPRPAPQPTRSAYAAPPPRPAAAAPPPAGHAPPPMGHAPPMGAPSQGPGLMAQMAATAGGVAIGSAVGHGIGNMMSGGGSSHAAEQAPAPLAQNAPQGQSYSQPCEFEWKQFLDCAQNQSDISLCNGFNDVFKQCQSRYA